MSGLAIIQRIINLFATLKNPYFFYYHMHHYMNKNVPYNVARYINKRNIKEYKKQGSKDFLLETCDGSGQSVHPDIAIWNDQYWLVVTPYPYGMEEYENPCIYQGSSLNDLRIPLGPVAIQHKHTQGVHLSDPCFAKYNNMLYCFYRESERNGQNEKQGIWEMKYNQATEMWSAPILLMNSNEDKLLSPAMLFDENGELSVYYVSSLHDDFMFVRERCNGIVREKEFQIIKGLPNNYALWHIGISRCKDVFFYIDNNNEIIGLFLVESKSDKKDLRLFSAKGSMDSNVWIVEKEICIPKDMADIVLFPYKSCYIPQSNGEILLSFRDKKSRNRYIIINGENENK